MKKLASLTCLFMLSGCGLAHMVEVRKQAHEARQVEEAAVQQCLHLYPDENAKPAMPRVKCMTDAQLKYANAYDKSVGNPDLAAVKLFAAKALVAAEMPQARQSNIPSPLRGVLKDLGILFSSPS
jgi:hypothetical protein